MSESNKTNILINPEAKLARILSLIGWVCFIGWLGSSEFIIGSAYSGYNLNYYITLFIVLLVLLAMMMGYWPFTGFCVKQAFTGVSLAAVFLVIYLGFFAKGTLTASLSDHRWVIGICVVLIVGLQRGMKGQAFKWYQIRYLIWCGHGLLQLTILVLIDDRILAGAQLRWVVNYLVNTFSSLILFFIAYKVVKYFLTGPSPNVVKRRPDDLTSTQTKGAVLDALSDINGVWCGHVDQYNLYASVQDRGVVIGPPGTGKTAFLVAQLLEWSKTGRPFICLDTKPEIYGITRAALEARGYRLLNYNPTAKTGHRYNPLADIDSPEGIGELSTSLIPPELADNAVFVESARDFLDAIITDLATKQIPTLPAVRERVARADDYKELLRELMQSEDLDARELANGLSVIANNERLLASIFANFNANLRFLRFPNIRASLEASDFSLSELTSDHQRVGLFLQFEEEHQETTARLLSTMTAHILRYFISNISRQPIFMMFDEIGNAPPIVGLTKKLNTIRSRQMPTWLYWQSREQMQAYGHKHDEGPNTILAACDFQMVFRLNDMGTAEWMSKRIGTVDCLVESQSVTTSAAVGSTISHSLVKEPIIFPHELTQLRNNEVICVYRGNAWRGEATPYYMVYPDLHGYEPQDLRGEVYATK